MHQQRIIDKDSFSEHDLGHLLYYIGDWHHQLDVNLFGKGIGLQAAGLNVMQQEHKKKNNNEKNKNKSTIFWKAF